MTFDPLQLKSELDRTQILLQDEKSAREEIELRLAVVSARLQSQEETNLAPPQVQNLVKNTDFGHSFDTYYHNPSAGDDERFECWNVYRHTVPTAAQQLLEDSIHSGVLVANSTALPDAGRSDTPNVDPDWDRAKGVARLGSTSTIDFPLPASLLNVYNPGRTLYCGLIVAKRSVDVTVPGGLFAGLWNNAATFRDWLPASAFAITGATVGTPGATTSRDYLVVAYTDWGRTITSAAVTVANAPADGNFVSGSVYVKLSWTPMAGVISYEIYRKTGAVYDLLAKESIANGYFDQGAIRTAGIAGYPATDDTNAIAYVATPDGVLDSLPVDGVDAAWQLVDFAINIPSTFALADATDKIWLRIGLTQALTGADATRGLLIDLVYLSYVSGAWAHHPDDEGGAQNPITSGTSQGGTGSGGPIFTPPEPGEGGPRCIAEDSIVVSVGRSVEAKILEPFTYCVLSPQRDIFHVAPVKSIQRTWAEKTLIISSASGHKIRCSPTEPFKQNLHGRYSAVASSLKVGDSVVVCDERREFTTKITEIEEAEGCWVVMISLQGRRKFFIAAAPGSAPGGFILHNLKTSEGAF